MHNKCFICESKPIITLENLRKHFSTNHNLIFLKGNCFQNFQCGLGCDSIFSSFKSYRAHTIAHFKTNELSTHPVCDELQLESHDITNSLPNSLLQPSSLAEVTLVQNTNKSIENISESIKSVICDLRNTASVSEVDFKKFIQCHSKLNTIILEYFKIPCDDIHDINKIINKFKSFNAQKNYFSKNMIYVEPVKIVLGRKSEMRVIKGKCVLKTIFQTCHYIPIIKTII